MIVQPVVEQMDRFAALVIILSVVTAGHHPPDLVVPERRVAVIHHDHQLDAGVGHVPVHLLVLLSTDKQLRTNSQSPNHQLGSQGSSSPHLRAQRAEVELPAVARPRHHGPGLGGGRGQPLLHHVEARVHRVVQPQLLRRLS